ncbi:MAG: hypothetical protein N2C14_03845 [Planctomycetales bacterium]
MKKLLPAALILLGVAAACVELFPTAEGQEKGKTRPLTTHDLMEGVFEHHHESLAELLKGGLKDKRSVKVAVRNASLLNECSYILMADGRCPSAEWKEACDTLRHCSEVLIKKIQAQDVEGANGAFKAMNKSCAGCHKKHKTKK